MIVCNRGSLCNKNLLIVAQKRFKDVMKVRKDLLVFLNILEVHYIVMGLQNI